MEPTQIHDPKLRAALREFQQHRRLAALVRKMTTELERVNEDNAQLHAAVLMYREVVRRTNPLARHNCGAGALADRVQSSGG